jgi:hypothetical protein
MPFLVETRILSNLVEFRTKLVKATNSFKSVFMHR